MFEKSGLNDDGGRNYQFTPNARESFRRANRLAVELDSVYIDTQHLLLGILGQKQATATRILNNAGVNFEKVKTSLFEQSPKTRAPTTSKEEVRQLSETAKLALQMACERAQELNQDICGTEHIIHSILSKSQARATETLVNMNVDVNALKNRIEGLMTHHMPEIDIVGIWSTKETKGRSGQEFARELYQKLNQVAETRTKQRPSVLEHFSTDLTLKAQKGRLDPVVGRQTQTSRMITILNRRQKNNPVLIGEPGVGKTAIVEGLAHRIVNEDIPDSLIDKRIVTLDLASMIAGTKYRGEFEDRFRRVLSELTKNKKTIVFIDEIHLLVGAGAAEGAIDASNMLKPALARGNLQVIGATTVDEYTKHIEKDTALERRLQPIMVPETTMPETRAILRGLAKNYEDHHKIQISDEILVKTVQLADRYLNDRFMPDKAIDLLDEAAAHLQVEKSKVNPVKRDLWRRIKLINAEIEDLVKDENYRVAAQRKQLLAELEEELRDNRRKSAPKTKPQLSNEHLAAVVSAWTGIPVNQVIKSEAKSLLNLEKQLQKQIIGQPDAVRAVATAIRRSRSGISDPQRPIGSFLFLGPTGVGKTEMARVLASNFYGRGDALIKIDMSEFSERHTVSRLVGAPAGYVGFDHPGQLTEKVRRQPYSLILFDEIEKAHTEVFNLLLQILEDGVLTDAKGRTINFSNTIIILTSNLGAQALHKDINLGFASIPREEASQMAALQSQNEAKIQKELKTFMRPELINRFDRVIVFRPLSIKDIGKIVDVQLDKLKDRLLEQKIALIITPGVKNWLAKRGYDQRNGVRPLRRLIQDNLENAIAETLLKSGPDQDKHIVKLQVAKDEIKASLSGEN